MKQDYVKLILIIERLHRRFLDVIKNELDQLGIEDINNVQTLILYNISDENLTVGELTNRGYYLGSNVSYNIKKLVDAEFLIQERSTHDRRSVKVHLSEKGRELCAKIDDLYSRHVEELKKVGLDEEASRKLLGQLQALEEFWSSSINPHTFF